VRDCLSFLTDNRADDESPDLSPDGRRIVFLSRPKAEPLFQIHVMDIDGSNRRQLTHYGGYLTYPRWSPDGRQIAFLGSREDRMKLFVMDADGGHLRQISTDGDDVWMLAWRPKCP
jgi:TolB protein